LPQVKQAAAASASGLAACRDAGPRARRIHPAGRRVVLFNGRSRGDLLAAMTEPSSSTSSNAFRSRRAWRVLAAASALLAFGGSAMAGAGLGVINAVASIRGHQGPADLAYGPGDRQRFDVYLPGNSVDEADKASGSPLVIFIYGGSWNMGSRRDYRFAGEALAAQGFTVMVVDYRLYPEVRYPGFLEDCAQAVGYGLEHARELGADPRRVFLYGHSAGAYNVAMLALDPRWLRAVGHSPDELAGWVGLAGPYNFLPIGDPGVRLVFDWPATAPDTQPINHVADLARPLPAFIGAAVHDKSVYPEQNSVPLVERMQARGTTVRFKTYEHVNHALLVGSLQWPLTAFAPVLGDTAAFIREAAPVARPAVAAAR
jgi:acetyl esterase/lipase